MKLKTWIVCASAIAMALVTLRAAAPAVVETHVADAKKSAVRIRITHGLTVVIPTPQARPDYGWQIISNDARFLRPTSELKRGGGEADKQAKADPKAPAAETTWSMSFVALRPGRSILRLVYVPMNSKGEEIPIDSREIAVTVHSEPEPKTS
jgi:hypothetical protein